MQVSHGAKIVATCLGVAVCSNETWLNAEHIALAEGWGSSLVVATITASVSAAAALPLAERAWKSGQTGKAVGLVIFFLLMAGFSLGASVARTGGKADGDVSAAQQNNVRAKLSQEAYLAAQKTEKDECAKLVGTKCRKARDALNAARNAAIAAPPVKVEDSGADRIAAFLHVPKDLVQLYQPMMLPFAFQIGGFFLLMFGLAPGKPEPDVWTQSPPEKVTGPITTEAEAYRWMLDQILSAPNRQLGSSGRSLAAQCKIAPATFASWVKRWELEGKILPVRSGNKTFYTVPKARRVA